MAAGAYNISSALPYPPGKFSEFKNYPITFKAARIFYHAQMRFVILKMKKVWCGFCEIFT